MAAKIPRGEDHLICPLHRKPMSEVCHVCPWWAQLRGINQNTGQEVDEWNCSIAMLPMLMVNVANETRQGAAATESFRNESLKAAALQLRHMTPYPPQQPALYRQNNTKFLVKSAGDGS